MTQSFRFSMVALFAISVTCATLSSCASNEEFDARMDKRNEGYQNYDHRRRSRLDARQERTDAWFDRVMH